MKPEFFCAEDERDWLRQQLAASQAREQQLREALSLLSERTGYPEKLGECPEKHILTEAISLPSDTTALEAMIQKAGAVMRERCVEACHEYDNRIEAMRDCEYQAELAGRQAGAMRSATAIRALPGVKLDDLK